MKILLAPYNSKSHKIPMLSLYFRHIRKHKDFKCTFILPICDHIEYENSGIDVLKFDDTITADMLNDIDKMKKHIINRNKAIELFSPNIIIEDLNIETSLFSENNNISRISIQRTGIFRSSNPLKRNILHTHSIEKDLIGFKRKRILSFKTPINDNFDINDKDYFLANQPFSQRNIFDSQVKIIPGIPQIEVLPKALDIESYFYSGPLLLDDNINDKILCKLNCFLHLYRFHKKVFLTNGLIEKDSIRDIFIILIKKGYAIITTIFPPYDLDKSRVLYNNYLPLHFVISNVDLVIHHCGSGMYHYPLIHGKPSITLGTQCYDREEIALRLDELNLSKHTPSYYDDDEYIDKFVENMDYFETTGGCDKEYMDCVKNKIINTINSFDIKNVIKTCLNNKS